MPENDLNLSENVKTDYVNKIAQIQAQLKQITSHFIQNPMQRDSIILWFDQIADKWPYYDISDNVVFSSVNNSNPVPSDTVLKKISATDKRMILATALLIKVGPQYSRFTSKISVKINNFIRSHDLNEFKKYIIYYIKSPSYITELRNNNETSNDLETTPYNSLPLYGDNSSLTEPSANRLFEGNPPPQYYRGSLRGGKTHKNTRGGKIRKNIPKGKSRKNIPKGKSRKNIPKGKSHKTKKLVRV